MYGHRIEFEEEGPGVCRACERTYHKAGQTVTPEGRQGVTPQRTKLGLQLNWLYTLRIRSDYKPGKPLSVKQAEEAYKAAEQIVQKVEAKLR